MLSFRTIIWSLFGSESDKKSIYAQLDAADVPITSADCRSCSNPCDQGHDEFPSRLDIDTHFQLLGTVRPYCRQVFLSTGMTNWDNPIRKTAGSLATYLFDIQESNHADVAAPNSKHTSTSGLYRSTDSNVVFILNASHHSLSTHDDHETVLVFPDYQLVTDVHRSLDGAQALWDSALNPAVGHMDPRVRTNSLKSWILPYACVVFLCSHKSRDNRCSIVAPKLEHAFMQQLESQGWHAETDLDATICLDGPLNDSTTEQEHNDKLRRSRESKRVLILRSSHFSGHEYVGNCIIYTPHGSCVWYGRISPHEVGSIVEHTIISGLVLPQILRGGLNLSRPGCKTLNDW